MTNFSSLYGPKLFMGPTGATGATGGTGSTGGMGMQSFRNRIINGDMRIDQRNSGAAITPTVTIYDIDRWIIAPTQASKLTFQQVTDAPAGFTHSQKITVAAQFSPAVTDYFIYQQDIEGFNIADFKLGTASATTITISFWIKSSVTGNYAIALRNGDGVRSYVTTVAVTASWNRVSITIPGDTSGTWYTDTRGGLILSIDLGSGSNRNLTTGTWADGNYFRASTTVTFVNQVVGSTLNITGVQLEKDSIMTDFEFRPYSVELTLCQRYFQWVGYNAFWVSVGTGSATYMPLYWVPMRVTPTAGTIIADPIVSQSTGNVDTKDVYYITPHGGSIHIISAAAGNCWALGYMFSVSAEIL